MSIVLDGDNLATSGVINSSTSQASTSGTSIVFSVPTTAKRITVMFQGVSTNGTANYQVQIGTGGSPTISGYLSTSSAISTAVTSTAYTTGFGINNAAGASSFVVHGSIVITLLGSNNWVASGVFAGTDAARTVVSGGSLALGGSINYLRVIASGTGNPSDTFDAGSINIFYE